METRQQTILTERAQQRLPEQMKRQLWMQSTTLAQAAERSERLLFWQQDCVDQGDKAGAGDDVGEVMIGNAEVVGMWNKPTNGLSSIVPNSGYTIDVDGTERPRTNSNGKPIAGTDEALRKFWRWFKNSAVVDDKGR